MTNKVTVIIPTTGAKEVEQAINSVLKQSLPSKVLLVVDGKQYKRSINFTNFYEVPDVDFLVLPENTGRMTNIGFDYNGNRIIAGCVHFVNTPYVCWLDQDNWLDENHCESLVSLIEQYNLDYAYSYRKVYRKDGTFIDNDDCISLGLKHNIHRGHLIDSNCWMVPTDVAVHTNHYWHGTYDCDRFCTEMVMRMPNRIGATELYTVNYRLGGISGWTEEMLRTQNSKMRYNK